MTVLIVLGGLYFMLRSDPVEGEIQRAAEVGQSVDSSEKVARKNYLKSPIDRTSAVVKQVNATRSDSDF